MFSHTNTEALEIIFDLPFGFPINNIISLSLSLSLSLSTEAHTHSDSNPFIFSKTKVSDAANLRAALIHDCHKAPGEVLGAIEVMHGLGYMWGCTLLYGRAPRCILKQS